MTSEIARSRARIFQQPKTAMQSGRAGTEEWVLTFAPSEKELNDPMMGWWGSADTNNQLRLRFDTREEAVAFAERKGLVFDLELPPVVRPVKPKAYSDNFRFGRAENWTH